MYNIGKKSSKTIIIFLFLLTLTVSCKQSCFDVITHNHVGYWSRYWTQEYPYGVIIEYSKKDSIIRYINNDWTYIFRNTLGDIRGTKFRITNDTLFHYIDIKEYGYVIMCDTIPIVSYSKDTIIITNKESEIISWHRLPTKLAKKHLSPGQRRTPPAGRRRRGDIRRQSGYHQLSGAR